MTTRSRAEVLQFDDYELDLSNRELRRAGKPVALQPQAFRALAFLVSRNGQTTTRKEIQRELWGEQTYVDFDCGLNFCIRQIRKALGEGARSQRYLQTLHRRGYRFAATVNREESTSASAVCVQVQITATPRPAVVAVLPFIDLSSSNVGNRLAEGITELLTTSLAADRSLRVLSRTTSARYKGLAKSLPKIGRELGADRIMEGSVYRSGGRVRVTARLIDVETDQSRWGSSYDLEIPDLLTLQACAVRALVRDCSLHLGPYSQSDPPQTSIDAAESFYRQGCYHLNKRNERSLFRAVACFEQAIALAPESAGAYTGLASTYAVLGYYGPYLPREMHSKATAAAQKAIRLDAMQAGAHAVLAYCSMLYDWNWDKAEAGFRSAMSLDPQCVVAHQWYGDFLTTVKRHDQAIEEMRRARDLDPLSLQIQADLGWVLFHANRYDEAIDQYLEILKMEPDFWLARWGLGLAYSEHGLFQDAIASLDIAVRTAQGTPSVVAALGHVLAASGRKREALRLHSNLLQRAKDRYIPAYDMATVTWGLGDVARTMSWLDEACHERSAYLVNLGVDSRFKKLRALEPIRKVERLIGMPCS